MDLISCPVSLIGNILIKIFISRPLKHPLDTEQIYSAHEAEVKRLAIDQRALYINH